MSETSPPPTVFPKVVPPVVVASARPAATASIPVELRKKDLILRVVERSGMKPRDVRPVVEAMLEVMGDNLSAGHAMRLNPLGKLRVQKIKANNGSETLTCKLRRPGNGPAKPRTDAAE